MKDIINIVCDEGATSRVVIGSVEENFESLLPGGTPRIIIVTDAKVHANNLAFVNAHEHIVIGQGESSKTFVKLEEVYRQLLHMGADRSTFIVGMGGGIVTDVTGFVASTYMRGVRFGFLPTTLLAQVDASIGGKNGVNLDGYKNIIGVFNQPEFVLCDPELLSSLPDREFRAGLAEVIKAGIIGDAELFSMVERHSFEEIRSDAPLLRELIIRSIRVKTAIVEHDQRERGERRKLNLGHTFAHAIEKSFTNLSHGEAVAAGMAIVCDAAVRAGKLDEATADRIRNVISAWACHGVPGRDETAAYCHPCRQETGRQRHLPRLSACHRRMFGGDGEYRQPRRHLPRRGEGTPETGAAVRRTGRSPGSSRKSQRLRSS